MNSIFESFDLVKIINLRERKDRHRDTIRELLQAGVDIDGERVSFFEATKPKSAAGFPTVGARGCFTSHREVLREAIGKGAQNILVLEDDIEFADQTNTDFKILISDMQSIPWDIIYFGYENPEKSNGKPGLQRWEANTIGGHFYGVSAKYMREMLEFMDDCETRPPGHPLGGPMFRDGAYNLYAELNPDIRRYVSGQRLAGQRSTRTDLHTLRFYDNIPLLRGMANSARTLRAKLKRL